MLHPYRMKRGGRASGDNSLSCGVSGPANPPLREYHPLVLDQFKAARSCSSAEARLARCDDLLAGRMATLLAEAHLQTGRSPVTNGRCGHGRTLVGLVSLASWGAFPCVVGAEAAERAAADIRAYYAYRGATTPVGEEIPSSAEAIRAAVRSYEEIGMDELVLRPHIAELDQVSRLAEFVT